MAQAGRHRRRRIYLLAAGLAALALATASSAFAHVERTTYWPDPRPDNRVTPAAGGAVPKVRSLA